MHSIFALYPIKERIPAKPWKLKMRGDMLFMDSENCVFRYYPSTKTFTYLYSCFLNDTQPLPTKSNV